MMEFVNIMYLSIALGVLALSINHMFEDDTDE